MATALQSYGCDRFHGVRCSQVLDPVAGGDREAADPAASV